MNEKICDCGRKIAMCKNVDSASNPNGYIPLDLVSPVYFIDENGHARRAKEFYVSHFVTCKNSVSHSKKNKR